MASKKPKRGLTADDHEVWRKVTKTVTQVETPQFSEWFEKPKPKSKVPAPLPSKFEITPPTTPRTSFSLTPNTTEVLRNAAPQMDRKNFDRLRKGKLTPDRRVDLHGMTAQAAHQRLHRFILDAHQQGARLVLVITGKGRTHGDPNGIIPQRKGIIRHSVPEWLRQSPLRERVVQAIPAHRKHGGDGAYYVYLNRKR